MRERAPLQAQPGTTLLLIRHGETEWNRERRFQGVVDVSLSERGRSQAELLAAWLAHEPLDAIYSSDLLRARATAETVAAGRMDVVLEPRFREAGFGVFEGLTHEEAKEAHPHAYHAWRANALRHRPPGGETLEALTARCIAAVGELLPRHPGGTMAVVAHGGPVRALVCELLGMGLALYPVLSVDNASITRLRFGRRGPSLVGLNDIGHLRHFPRAAAPGEI
jgi:probable phosphoglycerate mutase